MNIKYFSLLAIINYTSMQAVTVEEAIIAANANNKEWSAQQTDKKIANEQHDMSKKMFLPSITGHVDFSLDREKDFPGQPEKNSNNMQIGATITQHIFNGFQTVNTIEANAYNARAASYVLKSNEESLILKVIEAYSAVWFYMQKVNALRKKENNFLKTLTSQKSCLDAGMATPSDVAAASANHQKAIYERISAETELFSAASEFEQLTGLKATDDMELPNINIELPYSLDKLVNEALKANSAIIAKKMQASAATKTLQATKGKLLPSCDLSLSATNNHHQHNNHLKPYDYNATLRVTIPIFQNDPEGNAYSQINIKNQEAMKAKFLAEDKILEIKKECIVTWNNYISANAMINASRSAVKSAELSSESNIEETALGMKSNTDVWVKENNLLESRVDLANSQRQKFVASIKLLGLTGKLSIKSILNTISNKNISPISVRATKTTSTK